MGASGFGIDPITNRAVGRHTDIQAVHKNRYDTWLLKMLIKYGTEPADYMDEDVKLMSRAFTNQHIREVNTIDYVITEAGVNYLKSLDV